MLCIRLLQYYEGNIPTILLCIHASDFIERFDDNTVSLILNLINIHKFKSKQQPLREENYWWDFYTYKLMQVHQTGVFICIAW